MIKRILLEVDMHHDEELSRIFLDHVNNFLKNSLQSFNIRHFRLSDENCESQASAATGINFNEGRFTTLELDEQEFIAHCVKAIAENIDDDTFTTICLAKLMNLSKATFYRKIKATTGLNARGFMRKVKMQIAYNMLVSRQYNVSEVAWRCGYANARHFSKVFFEFFQTYPSKLLEKNMS